MRRDHVQRLKKIKEWLINKAKSFSLPGFDNVPIYEVGKFFILGIRNGSIRQRAGSVAFSTFLSIFPGVIFLFSLIPYIPINNFQDSLLSLFADFVPNNVYKSLETTIVDIVTKKRTSLLSVTFFLTIFFASSGVVALMRAFNSTYHTVEIRAWWKRRLLAIIIIVIEVILLTAAVGFLTVNRSMYTNYFLGNQFLFSLLTVVKVLIGLGFFFFSVSFIFYFAPVKKGRFRFISPGASLTTILMVAASYGFRYFVNNFGQFNRLYGSLGTIIVSLIWIYIVCFALIIGFELNASIMEQRRRNGRAES